MKKNEIYIADTEPLEDVALFEYLYRTLPQARRQKIDRLRRVEDKRLSLGAGVLLSRALAYHGIDTYTVVESAHGKPYLEGCGDLFFSLSHSGERVMCVLSPCEVGCDVQWMDPRIDPSLADRFFAAEESAWVSSAPSDAERTERFFRLWTLKESVMKATGKGFSLSPRDFSFSMESGELPRLWCASCDLSAFSSFEVYAESDYRYAVCGICNQSKDVSMIAF